MYCSLTGLDEEDVCLGEAVGEEDGAEVVLRQQELQHVEARLLVAPLAPRPRLASKTRYGKYIRENGEKENQLKKAARSRSPP